MAGPVPRFTPEQLDRFARELAPLAPRSLDVLLDVTNQCNLKCRMCYFSFPEVFARPAQQMSPEVFARVAAQTFPWARMVVLSAGCEPLVHDDFPGLLALAAPYAVPQLKYLTNAQLLDERVARASIEHGVTEVHVSIDGATPDTYEWVRRGASFARLIENLEHLRDLKLALGSATPVVQFNITLMRRNVHELPAFARLARRLGVQQLSCRHLLPYAGLDIDDECLVHDRAGANAALEVGLAAAAAEGLAVVMYPDPFEDAPREQAPWSSLDRAATVVHHVGFELRLATSFAGATRQRASHAADGAAAGEARVIGASVAPTGSRVIAPAAEATAESLRPSAAPTHPSMLSRPSSSAATPAVPPPTRSTHPTLPATPMRATPPASASPQPARTGRPAGFGWWPRRLAWPDGPPADPASLPVHPFGHVDLPADTLARRGHELTLSGWALHQNGVRRVVVCRRTSRRIGGARPTDGVAHHEPPAIDGHPSPGGDAGEASRRIRARALEPLVEARRIVGGRPDVAARFATLPDAERAGWHAQLDVHALPTDRAHELLVVVEGRDGRLAIIGRRLLVVDASVPDPGLLYCVKPFRSVYLDAGSNVYPYPDCQTVTPFARLSDGTSFEALWYGEAFTTLRRRILALDPPSMCRGCPDFVNRNPDDPDYYVPRQLAQTFRLPLGVVDGPTPGVPLPAAGATLSGWAAGFSPVVRVEILRESVPTDDPSSVRDDGLLWWADAWLGDARDDVARAHPRLPDAERSGWSVGLLGTGLPADVGDLVLHVFAHNADGARVALARLVIERVDGTHWRVVADGDGREGKDPMNARHAPTTPSARLPR